MPKFFQRRSPTATTTTTTITPHKLTASSKPRGGGMSTPDSFPTPSTVDLSGMTTTPLGGQGTPNNDNDDDAQLLEEPWDVIQASFSDDGTTSDANSNTTPTPLMRQTIQQRMNRLRYNEEEEEEQQVGGKPKNAGYDQADAAVQGTVAPKILRTTSRSLKPLSPPATDIEPQRLPVGSSHDDTEDRDMAEMDPEDLEDMPEDEKEQYLQALGLCGFEETRNAIVGGGGDNDVDNNFCDYTLTTLGEFCGIGPSSYDDAHKKPDPSGRTVLTKALPVLKPPYGVEEQTAIEVEYIHPERRQDVKSDASSTPGAADAQQTKNRLVQAMARRAKLDFETKKGKPATVSASPTPAEEEDAGTAQDAAASSAAATPDNVYSSFSSSEKRMFLKLINSGLTPSDATAQVLKEREEAAAEDGEGDVSAGKPPLPRGDIINGLESSSPILQDQTQQDNAETFAKSGIGYYDGANKGTGEEEEVESNHLSGPDRKSPKNRMAKLAKFGFPRPKGKHVGDHDELDREVEEHVPPPTARDPPPEPPPADRSAPTSPPIPINTARNLDAVAESRSIFKPISPRSPEPEEEAGRTLADDRALPSVMSEDSLLDDDEALSEKEPEIVVPSALETSYDTTEDEEDTKMNLSEQSEEDIVSSRIVRQPLQAPVQASPPRAMITEGLDLDVETAYMNSTELMSQYNANSVSGDHHTVRTQGTYMTTGTNYTTSTRSRRPGASKQRLTSQITGGSGASANKYKGWQVSIQEAAAGIGKVWDPVKGWVDYKEAEDEKKDDTFDSLAPAEYRSIATIPEHASASSTAAAQVASSVSSPEQAAASSVASPDSLAVLPEKDMPEVHQARTPEGPTRQGALSTRRDSTPPVKDSPHVLEEKAMPLVRTRTPEGPSRQGAASSLKIASTTPVRSRGWVETMKEATAKLAGHGKRWDPDRGWVGPNDDDSALNSGRYRSAGIEGPVESDTQDFGTIQVAQVAIESAASPHIPREPSGQKPTDTLRQDPVGNVLEHQHQTDDTASDHLSVDTSLKSAATGRYIQLGDTGSVASYYYGNPSNKTTPGKERMGTLESTPESKDEDDASSEHQPQSTLLVNVKKEKVDPSEAKLFPEISKSSRGAARSTGPVDLDDEDDDDDEEEENAIFADAPGFSWDEDDFGNASDTKKKVSDGKSVSTASTIPRLPAPKRDTSPIRGRGTSANKASPQQLQVPSSTVQQVTPSPVQKERATSASASLSTPIPFMKSRASPVAMVTPTSAAQPAGHGPDRSLKKFPTPTNDTVTTPASSSSVNNVRELHQYWEKRSVDKPITPPNAEWKSFLSKKVMAENSAVESRNRPSATGEEDRDTLFDFGSEGAYSGVKHVQGATNRNTDLGLRQLEQISNLSPIRTVHDDDDEDEDDDMNAPSEVSTAVVQGKTFMERIQACAAPIMPRQLEGVNCNPMPLAHLNFMRRNNPVTEAADSQQSRAGPVLVPKSVYGKPDVIVEEDDEDEAAEDRRSHSARKPQGSLPSKGRGDVSSVISDEQFGQKTAYLEAIAMKAAVSGSKKTRRTRSSDSESSGNIKHSESWQRFLDKKNAATSEDQESVQRAAEEYATKKIDQMMAKNRPAEFDARPLEEATGAFPSVKHASRFKVDTEWKTESTRAAEDLAAARVEALMHSLSTKRALDEEEGEI